MHTPQVAGLERQPLVGHDRGSSHGHSRIIRLAYFEGTQYGPLLVREGRGVRLCRCAGVPQAGDAVRYVAGA